MKISRTAPLLAFCAILLAAGCDKNPLGTTDTRGRAPSVARVTISPPQVWIDTLKPVSGEYHARVTIAAAVTDQDGPGNIGSVDAVIVDPSGNQVAEVGLHDDGASPDVSRGDGTYSGYAEVVGPRSILGTYHAFVTATDTRGIAGNSVGPSFLLFTRHNSRPVLSHLVAPDTVTIPTNGIVVPLTVVASDSDGQSDIRQVAFRNLDASNPTQLFLMQDDGERSVSGDTLAGDGVYSILLGVPYTARRGLFRLSFQATDAFGDTSATLLHPITIR